MLFFFSLLFGLGVGSFLNVVIMRGARGETLDGRSYCETCHKTLSFRELIPVLSFFLQKGRCTSCRAKISFWHPAVEAGTAFLYGLAAWQFKPIEQLNPFILIGLIGLAAGIASAVVIFVSDLRYKIIPTGPVGILTLAGLAAAFYRNTLLIDIPFALASGAFLASLWFFSRGRWMGFGDAKLIFAASLIVGYYLTPLTLLFAFWLGGTIGAILIILRKKSLSDQIPFGPFIILGATLAHFWGKKFLEITGILPFLD